MKTTQPVFCTVLVVKADEGIECANICLCWPQLDGVS